MAHKPQFTWEQFVQVWQESSSVEEVISKLGVSRTTVEQAGTTLRRAGVALKSMRGGSVRAAPDVGALNALIANLTDERDEGDKPEAEQRVEAAS